MKWVSCEGVVFEAVLGYFKENSFYKCLLLMFIEANLIFITFYSFLQLSSPSFFNGKDKFNTFFAVSFLFASFFFSFTFYILVYAFCNKEEAEAFINFTDYNIKGYICETLQVSLKNFANGFAHAYLIRNYTAQMVTLIAIKSILFAGVIYFRNVYINKLIKITFFFYFFICRFILFLEDRLLASFFFWISKSSLYNLSYNIVFI